MSEERLPPYSSAAYTAAYTTAYTAGFCLPAGVFLRRAQIECMEAPHGTPTADKIKRVFDKPFRGCKEFTARQSMISGIGFTVMDKLIRKLKEQGLSAEANAAATASVMALGEFLTLGPAEILEILKMKGITPEQPGFAAACRHVAAHYKPAAKMALPSGSWWAPAAYTSIISDEKNLTPAESALYGAATGAAWSIATYPVERVKVDVLGTEKQLLKTFAAMSPQALFKGLGPRMGLMAGFTASGVAAASAADALYR